MREATAPPATTPALRAPSGPDVRLIATLALGHLVVDMIQGAVPAILPLLKMAHGLTYAASGALVLVGNTTSSLVQPDWSPCPGIRSRYFRY